MYCNRRRSRTAQGKNFKLQAALPLCRLHRLHRLTLRHSGVRATPLLDELTLITTSACSSPRAALTLGSPLPHLATGVA